MGLLSLSPYAQETINSCLVAIKSCLAWLLPSILGVATKLAYENKTKKITRARIVTSFVMAVFVGYLFDILCTAYKWDSLRGVIVSIGALSSETLVQYTLENVNRKNIGAALKRLFNIK